MLSISYYFKIIDRYLPSNLVCIRLPEAKASDGSRYGMDRLVKVLERNIGKSPEITVTDLKQDVDAFQPENDPFDDVTIMSIVWKGKD